MARSGVIVKQKSCNNSIVRDHACCNSLQYKPKSLDTSSNCLMTFHATPHAIHVGLRVYRGFQVPEEDSAVKTATR